MLEVCAARHLTAENDCSNTSAWYVQEGPPTHNLAKNAIIEVKARFRP
jgi:hypothetical protein